MLMFHIVYMHHLAHVYMSALLEHTYGFHRAEVIAALVSVLTIWVLTGFLVMEAIERIRKPQVIDARLVSSVTVFPATNKQRSVSYVNVTNIDSCLLYLVDVYHRFYRRTCECHVSASAGLIRLAGQHLTFPAVWPVFWADITTIIIMNMAMATMNHTIIIIIVTIRYSRQTERLRCRLLLSLKLLKFFE